jgi:transcriptional regulator with XRE-family HTH domain
METDQLAKRIRAFRKLKRYTQLEMARQLGVSVGIFGSIERGTRKVDDEMLKRISELLQVPLAELAPASGERGTKRWD